MKSTLRSLLAVCTMACCAWGPAQKFQPTDVAVLDEFGVAVAMSGDKAIIGSRGDDDKGASAGAAYVLKKTASGWVTEAKLLAPDGAAGDYFGQAVAISGAVAVVGAFRDDSVSGGVDSGSAHVYRFSGSAWTHEAKLVAADAQASDYFGWAVGIDGTTIIVGAYGEDDGGNSAGAAYAFNYNGSTWTQEARLKAADADATDYFGVSVGVSAGRAVVGAYLDEQVASSAGSAYVFKDNGSTWAQEAKFAPVGLKADDRFGHSVAISGDTLVVGAVHDDTRGLNAGAAYVLARTASGWAPAIKLTAQDGAGNDKAGVSVAVSGDLVVVGAWWDDEGPMSDSGAAYLFRGPAWAQEAKLVAPDPYFWEYFGNAVGVSGTNVIVAAYNDNSGGMDAGAVYAFTSGGSVPACSNPSECNDGDPCTVDNCVNWNCTHVTMNCDDMNACTTDACANGVCVHAPKDCDDGNACTVDSCVAGACKHCRAQCSACSVAADCCSGQCVGGACK